MNELYLGTLVSIDVWRAVSNVSHLFAYVDMAAINNLPVTNSETYLKQIENNVSTTFGPHLVVSFFDPHLQEQVDEVGPLSQFHLMVSLRDSFFYSKAIH